MAGFLSLIVFRDKVGRKRPIVVRPHATLHPGNLSNSPKLWENANSHKRILQSHGLYFLDIYAEAGRVELKVPGSCMITESPSKMAEKITLSPNPEEWEFHWDTKPPWLNKTIDPKIRKECYAWAAKIMAPDYQPPGAYIFNPAIKPIVRYRKSQFPRENTLKVQGSLKPLMDMLGAPLVYSHSDCPEGNWIQEIHHNGAAIICSSYKTLVETGYNHYFPFVHKDVPNPKPANWKKGLIPSVIADAAEFEALRIANPCRYW